MEKHMKFSYKPCLGQPLKAGINAMKMAKVRSKRKINRHSRFKTTLRKLPGFLIGTSLGTLLSITAAHGVEGTVSSPVIDDNIPRALNSGKRGGIRSGACNVPTDAIRSPLFDAEPFSQQMLRFEEFGPQKYKRRNIKKYNQRHAGLGGLPLPSDGDEIVEEADLWETINGNDLDAKFSLLSKNIYPYPTLDRDNHFSNPWESVISKHTGPLVPLTTDKVTNPECLDENNNVVLENCMKSFADGRAPGPQYAHQRWAEFFPQVNVSTGVAGARTNTGLRDNLQRHKYQFGEFGPGGLYHNTVGNGDPTFNKTTEGIEVKFHPNMPVQDHQALWTFDGTFPPKLMMARYGEGALFRNYNLLPIPFAANRGFGSHFITTHRHNGHQPAEGDGYAHAFFLPGQHYDYHWPMIMAGHDTINIDATEPKASTPCTDGETLMVSYPSPATDGNGLFCSDVQKRAENATKTSRSVYGNAQACGWRRVETACQAGRINLPGDYHEIMSTHWFHDHMLDHTAQNVYKGNAGMFNMYSALDRGNEWFDDGINLRFPSGRALGDQSWGNRDYDVNLELGGKAWGQDTQRYKGTKVENTEGQLWFNIFNSNGFLGDVMTVNWLHNPYFEVRARKYRFRILNAHVSRFLRVALVVQRNHANGDSVGEYPGENPGISYDSVGFHMIANDGNIMEHAVPFDGTMDLDRDGDLKDHHGLLPTQSIAERYDIIVDFSENNPANLKPGDKLYMVNLLEHENGRRPERQVPLADVLSGKYAADGLCDSLVEKMLEFQVKRCTDDSGQEVDSCVAGGPANIDQQDHSMNPAEYVPGQKTMIPLPHFGKDELANANFRTFHFGRGAQTDTAPETTTLATIRGSVPEPMSQLPTKNFNNGDRAISRGNKTTRHGKSVLDVELVSPNFPHLDKPWGIETDDGNMLAANMHRLSAAPTIGNVEIWQLTTGGGWSHNVHVHFEEGVILTRGGQPPPEWEKWARKDVYRVGRMDDSLREITFAIRFREFAGSYMEHCHNTQHEDNAMLLRWDIENPGQLKPFLTPEPQWNGCTYTESVELPTASAARATTVGNPGAKEDYFDDHPVQGLLCQGGETTSCPGGNGGN